MTDSGAVGVKRGAQVIEEEDQVASSPCWPHSLGAHRVFVRLTRVASIWARRRMSRRVRYHRQVRPG